ncbi:MAG: FtsQ-type POTRA domain-containing protein [Alphaproteobacteria bacterium]|nr:FtsQ-type POTRA domain-containing protein [Alphaproteobacteria bacterium]
MRPLRGQRRQPVRAASTRRNGRKEGRTAVAPHRQPRRRASPSQTSAGGRVLNAVAQRLGVRHPLLTLCGVLLALSLAVVLIVGGYVRAAGQKIDSLAASMSNYAGFGISKLTLTGENHTSPQMILAVLNLKPGQSIFDVNLGAARARLLALPWVRHARVTRRYPDSIFVDITEKTPFALWQSAKGLYVISRSGAPIVEATPQQFPKLPVFIGDQPVDGAKLVAAIDAHPAIRTRLTAMQRVAQRRWNLILNSGVVAELPGTGWRKQLGVLERLIVDDGVLDRNISQIDLRSPDELYFTLRDQKAAQPQARENKA